MSSTTIHYINANHKRFDDSLVRQSDLDDDRFVYSQCPVYNHKSNRVFVGTSPIDFKLKICFVDIINEAKIQNCVQKIIGTTSSGVTAKNLIKPGACA